MTLVPPALAHAAPAPAPAALALAFSFFFFFSFARPPPSASYRPPFPSLSLFPRPPLPGPCRTLSLSLFLCLLAYGFFRRASVPPPVSALFDSFASSSWPLSVSRAPLLPPVLFSPLPLPPTLCNPHATLLWPIERIGTTRQQEGGEKERPKRKGRANKEKREKKKKRGSGAGRERTGGGRSERKRRARWVGVGSHSVAGKRGRRGSANGQAGACAHNQIRGAL